MDTTGSLYLTGSSRAHSLDFWTKAFTLLLALPLAALIGQLWVLGLASMYLFFLIWLSRTRIAVFWHQARAYIILLTAASVILGLAFLPGSIPERAVQGLLVGLRLDVAIGAGVLFALITNPLEIPIGLLRIKMPQRYGVMLMVALRMLSLIARRTSTVVMSQRARGTALSLRWKNLPRLPLQAAAILLPLFYVTLDISLNMTDTLLARGYDPHRRLTLPPSTFSRADIIALGASTLTLAVGILKF